MATAFLRSVLQPCHVVLRLQGEDKAAVIDELVDVLAASGVLSDPVAARGAVHDRERSMSTGMENGVALPHGKTDAVQGLLVAVGLKPEGVDFDCVDGQPARIILLIMSPQSRTGPHIRFMAEVSRILSDASTREHLLSCESTEAAVRVLNGES